MIFLLKNFLLKNIKKYKLYHPSERRYHVSPEVGVFQHSQNWLLLPVPLFQAVICPEVEISTSHQTQDIQVSYFPV